MRLLQLTGGHESIDISWLLGPQQQWLDGIDVQRIRGFLK